MPATLILDGGTNANAPVTSLPAKAEVHADFDAVIRHAKHLEAADATSPVALERLSDADFNVDAIVRRIAVFARSNRPQDKFGPALFKSCARPADREAHNAVTVEGLRLEGIYDIGMSARACSSSDEDNDQCNSPEPQRSLRTPAPPVPFRRKNLRSPRA